MNNEISKAKKHGWLSYLSLTIGIICFFIVFVTPTRLAFIGNELGDYITYFFTAAGIIMSLIALKKEDEKNLIPVLSLILSLSMFIFWIIIIIILLFTGQMDFAP